MGSDTEIELKIEVPVDAMRRLRAHPLVSACKRGRARIRTLHTVYYDTADLLLRDHGASLRVRHQGKRRIQNVKTRMDGSGGVLTRGEWEHDIGTDRPDPSLLAETGLAGLLDEDRARTDLRPVFATRVTRTAYTLSGSDWTVELVLDDGVVDAGDRATEVHEVELELLSGTPADLYRLARDLVAGIDARISTVSKSDRGYALATGTAPEPVKAAPLALSRTMSSAAAFQEIGHACLGHLLVNEPALRRSRAPEAVHQMRVAMRRFRSALTLFKPLVDTAAGKEVRAEVKWATDELGEARDLDVFLAEILDPVRKALPEDPGLRALEAEFETRREAAYARALDAVRSERFTRMILTAAEWIDAGDWRAPGDEPARARLDRPVKAYASGVLAAHRRKVLKRGRHFAKLDPEARHRVRIEVKKMRYAVDFFRGLYGKKKVKPFTRALAALQEHLGAMNDIAVAHALLHALIGETGRANQGAKGRERAFAAGLVAGWHEAEAGGDLKAAAAAWKTFTDAKPFWE